MLHTDATLFALAGLAVLVLIGFLREKRKRSAAFDRVARSLRIAISSQVLA